MFHQKRLRLDAGGGTSAAGRSDADESASAGRWRRRIGWSLMKVLQLDAGGRVGATGAACMCGA